MRFRRFLSVTGLSALVATLILLVVSQIVDPPDRVLVLAMMSSLGLAVGCLLAALALGYVGLYRRMVGWTLVAIAVSQASYFLLVWSGWVTHSLSWRVWWVSMALSIHLTHLLLLRSARRKAPTRANTVALASAVATAALVALAAFRRNLLGDVPTVAGIVLAAVAILTVGSSLVVWWQHLELGKRSWRATRTGIWALLIVSHLLVLAAGLYIGHTGTTAPTDSSLPTALVHLSADEIETQIAVDMRRLEAVVSGLEKLESEMASHQASGERTAGGRGQGLLPARGG